jgi:hypothetical protein
MEQQQERIVLQNPASKRTAVQKKQTEYKTLDHIDFLKDVYVAQKNKIQKLRRQLSNPRIPFTFHELDELVENEQYQQQQTKMVFQDSKEYDDELLEEVVDMLHSMNEHNTESGKKFIKKIVEKFFRPQQGRMTHWTRAMNVLNNAMKKHGYTERSRQQIMNSASKLRQYTQKTQQKRKESLMNLMNRMEL